MAPLATDREHLDRETVRTTITEALRNEEKSIWEHYNELAAREDNIRVVEWRDLADTILIFDGLFAAFLSAFLIFTIPQLQPNSTDVAKEVLIHISQQLSNSTTLAYTPVEFTVSLDIAAINVLLFLSLALVLLDAFLAMLVKSWIHEFDRGWKKHTTPQRRAEERELLYQGLERSKLPDMIALLPILTQTSLLLFCIGLLVLIFPIHLISAIFSSLTLGTGFTLYWYTTCVSSLDIYAPFSSPISRGLQRIISRFREHEANTDPSTQALPGKGPQGEMGVEELKPQIPPKTYFDIVERLLVTAEALEDVPVLVALLDHPVRYPLLWLSNVEKWGKIWDHLVRITLKSLGDPPTFLDSVARAITRSVPFWYDGTPTRRQLSEKLMAHFRRISAGQTGQDRGLNSLLAPYLSYCCELDPIEVSSTVAPLSSPITSLSSTIASLKPSDTVDGELLWMVNTIHKNLLRERSQTWKSSQSFEFFSAVLVYVSSTQQCRRSKVPLTRAILHAMHPHSIDVPYARGSEPPIFRPNYPSELWSEDCSNIATHLLQPHKDGSGPCDNNVWGFQLALIVALYIESTRAAISSTEFDKLLKILEIPDGVIMNTSMWADAYSQTRIAGYQYMALFKESLYQQESSGDSHFRDIGYIITQTLQYFSQNEITLPALKLLDKYVGHLRAKASNLLTRAPNGDLHLIWSAQDNYITSGDLNPWILLHLDTAFPKASILSEEDITKLRWGGTPVQDHIAEARLALYNSLEREANQVTLDLRLLDPFLLSKNYTVCTGAFEWRLKLASTNPAMFNLETMGEELIKNLIQVLCRNSAPENDTWKFLARHLTPRFATLPQSWCLTFARAFLLAEPLLDKLPAYQCFTKALENQPEDFLFFLETLFDLERGNLGWKECNSLQDWLAKLPENCDHHVPNLRKKIDEEVENRKLAEDS